MASSSSSTSKEGASPLWMTPLWNCTSRREEEDYEENGHYEILQRIVGTHGNNNNAEMETALETFVHKGVALWRRVVVRSLSRVPVIHASYRLAQNNNESILGDDSVLCWTSFPTRPQHQMLCVLASPTVLCIWDVYPQPNNNNNNNSSQDLGSGEGHSIPLPFEASGIHAMMGQGLLLQRKETLEDRFAALDAAATATLLGDEDMEDMEEDGFILKAPPRPVRLRESTGTTTTTTNLHISTTNMSNNNNHSSVVVPSLFSLSHPLDDVLPISRLPAAGDFGAAVTDVLEKILFVGVLRWTDPSQAVIDRTEYSQPICVTYHAQRKRYVCSRSQNNHHKNKHTLT